MDKDTGKGLETFLRQMRIMGIDESNNTYDADNPASSAVGKYQYLWSAWKDQIQKKAKEWGENVGTEEEFKANEAFQERFFEWDQKNAYKEVKELAAKDNKLNLSAADYGVMRHRYGINKVKEIAKKGELPKAQYKDGKLLNPSAAVMLNKFRQNLVTNGIPYDDGKAKNMNRAYNLPLAEKKKIVHQYDAEVKKIEKSSTDPLVINNLKQELAKKYFAAGNLEIINHSIDYRNNNQIDRYKDLLKKAGTSIQPYSVKALPPDMKKLTPEEQVEFKKLDENFQKHREEFNNGRRKVQEGIVDGMGTSPYTGNDGRQKFKSDMDKWDYKNIKLDAPGGTKWNLDNFKMDDPPPLVDDSTPPPADARKTDGSGTATTTDTTPAIANVKPAVSTKFDDPLDEYNSQSSSENEQFNYEKGNFQFPFEALADGAMGIAGMAAADTKIPYRDEQVSAGMLDYAAKLAKIGQMGLPPEIEGDLKIKLASAYQTGMTNIVRASAGNRNLVLGNQGQLDEARMHGIAEIATLDVNRRDSAMRDYGAVMQYINEFDARRDIANKELDQNQAIEKRHMGAEVAAKGFSKLIENLNYQKEFGPGSANDMMSQAWLTNIYGYNPMAKDDGSGTKPGTKSYADKLVSDRKAKDDEGEKYKNFLLTLSPDDRQKVAKMQEKNPSLSPIQNRDGFKANALIEAFQGYTDTTDNGTPAQDAVANDAQTGFDNTQHLAQNAITNKKVAETPLDTSLYDSGAWKANAGIPIADTSEINVSINGTSKMPNVNPNKPMDDTPVTRIGGGGYNPVRDGLGPQGNTPPIVDLPNTAAAGYVPSVIHKQTPQQVETNNALFEAHKAIESHLKANEEFDKYFNQTNQ